MVNTKFARISNVDSVACQTWPAQRLMMNKCAYLLSMQLHLGEARRM